MHRKEKNQVWLQYGAAITASITSAGYGSIMSWTSPALTYLKSEQSEISITKQQISWIAPLLPIGLIIGNFVIPPFINRIGRKWTLMLLSIPQIISWLLIYFTKSYNVIYIARIMGGIGYGGGVCAVTVYLSEIGTPQNRGIFLSMVKFSLSLGIFITLLLGASVSYNYMNLGHLMMPLVFIVIFFFMPDSSYFVDKNKAENCTKGENSHLTDVFVLKEDSKPEEDSLLKENSHPQEISSNEENSLVKGNSLHKENLSPSKKSLILKLKESSIWKMFSTSNNLKALIIIVCMVAQDALSGHMILTYFSEQMLSYNGSLLSPKKGALFLSGMKLFACVVATQVIERLKRRTLYFFTGMLASVCQGIVGIFFFLEEKKINVSSFSFIPFVGLVIYEFSVTMGSSNLFYVLQGELFESDVKGLAVTFAKNMYMVFGFLSIIMYQIITEAFSTYVLFFIFCFCGITLCFTTVALMPETKGRNVQEIQLLLKKKNLF